MPGQEQDVFLDPYKSQYVAAPIDELAVLGKTLDDKYNANKALYDEDNLIHVNALDKDIPDRNKTLQGYTDQMAQIVKDNNGAYEKIGPQLSMITNGIYRDMTMGKLNAMENNYKSYSDYQKKINDRIEKGDITPDHGAALLYISKNEYQGVGEGGQNGIFNQFAGIEPAKSINETEEIKKLSDGYEKQKIENKRDGMVYDAFGNKVPGTIKTESDGNRDYRNFIIHAINNDAALQASIRQDEMINNYGRKFPDINSYANNLPKDKEGNIIGYNNVYDGEDLKNAYGGASDSDVIRAHEHNNYINGIINEANTKYGKISYSKETELNKAYENGDGTSEKTTPGFTTTYGGGVTENPTSPVGTYKSNLSNFSNQITDLNNKIDNEKDPSIKQQLINQKTSIEKQKNLTESFLNSAASSSGYNLNNEYEKFVKNPLFEGLPKEVFQDFINGKLTVDQVADYDYNKNNKSFLDWVPKKQSNEMTMGLSPVSIVGDNSSMSIEQTKSDLARIKYVKQLNDFKSNYDNSLKESFKNNPTVTTHQVIEGSNNAAEEVSKQITNAIKNGNINLLNEDGSIFDYKSQIADKDLDPKTIEAKPTKELIGGQPGYAVTAEGKDGKKSTYYVTEKDNPNWGNYIAIGKGLRQEAISGKYSQNPQKQNELFSQGNEIIGNGNYPQIKSLKLENMRPGDERELQIGSIKYKVIAVGDNNGKYLLIQKPDGTYLTDNSGTPAKFDGDNSIATAFGQTIK